MLVLTRPWTAAEDALHDNAEPNPDGMEALEEVLEEEPGEYACALVVALAHLGLLHGGVLVLELELDVEADGLRQPREHLLQGGELILLHGYSCWLVHIARIIFAFCVTVRQCCS